MLKTGSHYTMKGSRGPSESETGWDMVEDGTMEGGFSEENGRRCHMWTLEANEVLVDLLVKMTLRGEQMDEKEFKPGYLVYPELKMEERLLECNFKGNNDISRHLKKLKAEWVTVFDILYGAEGHNFKWDYITDLVVVNDAAWETYVFVSSLIYLALGPILHRMFTINSDLQVNC